MRSTYGRSRQYDQDENDRQTAAEAIYIEAEETHLNG